MTLLAILCAWSALDAFTAGDRHSGWSATFLVFFFATFAVLISVFGVRLDLIAK